MDEMANIKPYKVYNQYNKQSLYIQFIVSL